MPNTEPPARRRVAIAINTSWNVYNFRAGLVRSLVSAGYDVVAIAPPDAYSPRIAELGCRFVPLPMDNKGTSPLKDLLLFARFWRILRGEKPDAFLGYTVKPNVYGSLAAHLLGIPVINNIAGLGTAFIRASWLTRLVKQLYRLALGGSRLVFFQNEDDRRLFVGEGLVRPEKTALLPGSGIDLQRFRPAEGGGSASGESEASGPIFLLIARLLRDKGVVEYVDAARQVRRENPQARFRLLGFLDVENRTAICRDEVEAWVAEGTIDFLGARDDVRPEIATADCVVLPSYREGTPRTLLEAAAMGKPLIATDVPGCRQVVEDGVNGFFCEARSAESLAARMEEMIAMGPTKRAAMGTAGRAKMEREFDERIVVKRYLDALRRIAPPL